MVKVGDPDSVFCWETAVRMLIYSAAVYEEKLAAVVLSVPILCYQ